MIAIVFFILIICGNCINGAESRNYGHDSHGKKLSHSGYNPKEPLEPYFNTQSPHSLQSGSPTFTLLIEKIYPTGTKTRSITFNESENNEYNVDGAYSIELICIATHDKLKKWILLSRLWIALPEWGFRDGYNLSVFKSRVNRCLLANQISTPIESSNESTLIIDPDVDDIDQKVICERNGSKNITVKLITTNKPKIRQGSAIPIYLAKGANWHNTSCYGRYPNNTYVFKPGKQVMIEKFDTLLNGTVYYCIKYEIKKKNPSGTHLQPVGPVYVRKKIKYVFYLKSKKMYNPAIEGATEINTQVMEKNNNGTDTKSIAIVGGVLGTIIFILLGILLCVCYKILQRRRRPDDGATQVVYAEIEERSTAAPLPPPRNQAPYAMIIGILTPKQPPQTKSPPDYTYSTAKCQISCAENPYCVVE